MTTEIHKLVTRRQEVSEDTIKTLEDFLEMAKSGELISVAIAGVLFDGSVTHQASASDSQPTLLGAVSRLMHRMQLNADGTL